MELFTVLAGLGVFIASVFISYAMIKQEVNEDARQIESLLEREDHELDVKQAMLVSLLTTISLGAIFNSYSALVFPIVYICMRVALFNKLLNKKLNWPIYYLSLRGFDAWLHKMFPNPEELLMFYKVVLIAGLAISYIISMALGLIGRIIA